MPNVQEKPINTLQNHKKGASYRLSSPKQWTDIVEMTM